MKTRGRIALAVAELNGCDYCLSAHTWLGKNLVRLDEPEMAANREAARAIRGPPRRCGSQRRSSHPAVT